MTVLSIQNISKSFERRKVLDNVSFDIASKQTYVILGKSGEGKSTLLKIIAGMVSPDSGDIKIDGKTQAKAGQKLIDGNDKIKLVNQDFDLDLYHTVKENIRLKILHLDYDEQDTMVNELIDLFELRKIVNTKAINISGGEQQRLSIARAIAQTPQFLLLDEPFVHLDQAMRNKIEQYLQALKTKYGMAIILVTHDGKEALSWADEILYLKGGKIKRKATPKAFYESPKSIDEGLFFGELNVVKYNDKKIYFRPEAYKICNKNEGINAKINYNRYLGRGFLNYGTTENNESVVLESKQALKTKITFIPQ